MDEPRAMALFPAQQVGNVVCKSANRRIIRFWSVVLLHDFRRAVVFRVSFYISKASEEIFACVLVFIGSSRLDFSILNLFFLQRRQLAGRTSCKTAVRAEGVRTTFTSELVTACYVIQRLVRPACHQASSVKQDLALQTLVSRPFPGGRDIASYK